MTSESICRDIGPEPHLTFLRGNPIGMHATVLYDRRHLLDAGGFDVTLRRCEDYDVYLRMSRNYPVASYPQTVAEYRWHGANMSSDSLEMLRWVLRVLERYRPPRRSGPASAAWRQGRANWRRYYVEEILAGGRANEGRTPLVHRIANAGRASPTFTARHLVRRLKSALPRGLISTLKRLIGRGPPRPLGVFGSGISTARALSASDFGFDRGTPVDRYYIEMFLAAHSGEIRGCVLEVGDASYCREFGTGIVRQDVLHVATNNPGVTIVGDLSVPGVLPEGAFRLSGRNPDSALDLRHAGGRRGNARRLETWRRPASDMPGCFPGRPRGVGSTWFWSITRPAAERMFADVFGAANVAVEARGNVYAAVCFLEGLALEEVDVAKLGGPRRLLSRYCYGSRPQAGGGLDATADDAPASLVSPQGWPSDSDVSSNCDA